MCNKKKDVPRFKPCGESISCKECWEKAKEEGLAYGAKAIADDLEARFIAAWKKGVPLFDDPAKAR